MSPAKRRDPAEELVADAERRGKIAGLMWAHKEMLENDTHLAMATIRDEADRLEREGNGGEKCGD